MKKFHGIESILTKIENEENIEENLEELEDDKNWIGNSKKCPSKGRQKCPICSKSFKGSVMSGSCHIQSVLIGVEYRNYPGTLYVY